MKDDRNHENKGAKSRAPVKWTAEDRPRHGAIRAINRIEQARRSPSLATFDKLYRALEEGQAEAARGKPAAGKRKARK